jgi:hypothetical protein
MIHDSIAGITAIEPCARLLNRNTACNATNPLQGRIVLRNFAVAVPLDLKARGCEPTF